MFPNSNSNQKNPNIQQHDDKISLLQQLQQQQQQQQQLQ